ncbi:MAG: 50S ribosomal protein L32 [Oligoflexales bacterium]
MPVPKFRTSASKRNMRRSHHGLTSPSRAVCSKCGETCRPHRACQACSTYKGVEVKRQRDLQGDQDFQ